MNELKCVVLFLLQTILTVIIAKNYLKKQVEFILILDVLTYFLDRLLVDDLVLVFVVSLLMYPFATSNCRAALLICLNRSGPN
jgi:hypothetical protein